MNLDTNRDQTESNAPFIPQVHCCLCGLLIDSNPSNMCPACLRSHVDITEALQREYILIYCPECDRYLQPPQYWAHAPLESKELLTLCLKRIKGLNHSAGSNSNSNKAKLVDAQFIWTEPHSKRIKIKITIQKEIFNNIIIQQNCTVEYIVTWQQCPSCQKVATGQPQWDAVVQLRQKVAHKKTFLFLEQLILKKRLQENFVRIEAQPDGLDFYFSHKSHALNFLSFLNRVSPITRRDAVQLVSHDSKNNTAVQHFTFSIEIASLCREDLVLLPYKNYYTKNLSGLGPFVLVHKVYSSIIFFDPQTLRTGEITGALYWDKPFFSLFTSRELIDFYVLSTSLLSTTNGVYQLGLITVCLADEVGQNREWVVQSHLAGLVQPGDLVKGYLLENKIINCEDLDKGYYKAEKIPDVVLVRKHFPSQKAKRHKRQWKLKKLHIVSATGDPIRLASGSRGQYNNNNNNNNNEQEQEEEAEFEDEIERDKDLRREIAVYKKLQTEVTHNRQTNHTGDANLPPQQQVQDEDDDDDDEVPQIALEEMLDEFRIDDEENAELNEEEKKNTNEAVTEEDIDVPGIGDGFTERKRRVEFCTKP